MALAVTTRTRSNAGSVVGQIMQLVTTNETLRRENAELLAVNEQLRAQLAQIGSALGRLSGGPGRRGWRGALAVLAEAKPKRQRKRSPTPSSWIGAGRRWPRRGRRERRSWRRRGRPQADQSHRPWALAGLDCPPGPAKRSVGILRSLGPPNRPACAVWRDGFRRIHLPRSVGPRRRCPFHTRCAAGSTALHARWLEAQGTRPLDTQQPLATSTSQRPVGRDSRHPGCGAIRRADTPQASAADEVERRRPVVSALARNGRQGQSRSAAGSRRNLGRLPTLRADQPIRRRAPTGCSRLSDVLRLLVN